MIARVDDAVWTAISRFGHPFDPADFNTGFGRHPIGHSEAFRLGIIERRAQVAAPVATVSDAIAAAASITSVLSPDGCFLAEDLLAC